MRYIVVYLLLLSSLQGDTIIKIATYNLQNLFDLEKKGYRYSEYKPNTASLWNKTNYKKKLNNLAKVIKDVDADIIALQEIHSQVALDDLRFTLKQKGLYYQYAKIADKKSTTIKVAFLSKIKPIYTKELKVTSSFKHRNILEAKFKVDTQEFYLFINHWKAKNGPESMRIVSAKILRDRVQNIGYNKNIILVGDFNSDYEEHKKFLRKKRHNDTNGITGINHILRTLKQTKQSSKLTYENKNFYNLWYDTDIDKRYSYIYRRKKESLDNILISQSLLNKDGISYEASSIRNLSLPYMFKKKNIYRWQVSRGRIKKHKGKGYSDHLPVMAEFRIR